MQKSICMFDCRSIKAVLGYYLKAYQTVIMPNKNCQGDSSQLWNQYTVLNMDALNDQNFSYQILHSAPVTKKSFD